MEFLAHPLTAIVLCLILGAIAVSGKFSQHAANFLLALAWGIGVFAVMQSGAKDWRLLGAGICALTTVGLLLSWWVRPPKLQPHPPAQAALQYSTPAIDADDLANKIAKQLKKHPPISAPSRAHVHITKFEWTAPSSPGAQAEVKVIFENNGNAPVTRLIFGGHMGYFLLSEGRTAQLAFEDTLNGHPPELLPEANEIPVGVDRSLVVKSAPWSQQAIDRFLRREAVLYAAGIFAYSDGHTERKARFCGYTDAAGSMKFCAKGNEEP